MDVLAEMGFGNLQCGDGSFSAGAVGGVEPGAAPQLGAALGEKGTHCREGGVGPCQLPRPDEHLPETTALVCRGSLRSQLEQKLGRWWSQASGG